MAVPYYDFLTSAPIDQTGSALGTNFDYYNAFLNNPQYYQPGTGTADMANFTIGDQEYSLPSGSTYSQLEKYMTDKGASDLLTKNTGAMEFINNGSDSTGIGEIILPPIAGGGGGGGGGVEGAIDYNNLTLRDQSTGTGIDSDVAAKFKQYENYKFTDQDYANTISKLREYNPNFNSYTDQDLKEMIDMGAFKNVEPQKTGILEGLKTKGNALLDFIKKGGVIGNIASEFLPEMDPRQKALRDFYGDNFDLTSSGSVASGIMKGYNPVSGGGLYTLTGGRLGEEPTYGLGEAIDERMDNIKDMLGSKYGYSYTNDSQMYKDMIAGKIGKYGIKGHTSAAENYFKLKSIKEKEKIALDIARKKQQEKIEEQEKIQNKIYQESQTKKDVDKIQEKIGSKTGSASPYQGGSGGLHSNYNSSSTKGTNTSASKQSKSSSSKGTNQGYSQHFRDGGIVTL